MPNHIIGETATSANPGGIYWYTASRDNLSPETPMLFLVIESFADPRKVYARFKEKGRMAPDTIKYIDSWVDVTGTRCFQLMECDDLAPLMTWIAAWSDLATFEVIPVVPSKTAATIWGPPSTP
jgi:hypothetical protein